MARFKSSLNNKTDSFNTIKDSDEDNDNMDNKDINEYYVDGLYSYLIIKNKINNMIVIIN